MKKIISVALAGLLTFSAVGAAAPQQTVYPDFVNLPMYARALDKVPVSAPAEPARGAITLSTVDNVETEITFRIGDDTLRINGKDVTVVAPYEEDGTTLVPLRVISEAFDAKVDWEGTEEKITLTYDGVVIEIWIGRLDAYINGKQSTMLKAPVLKNDTTMVPLRFISENFGSLVSYDDATARVTVRKLAVCPLSTVNYGAVINSGKEYVGDSYLNWYTKMPENYRLTYRSFDGTVYHFSDGSNASVRVDADSLGEETLDTIYKKTQDSYKDKTIMDKTDASFNGRNFKTLTVVGESVYTKVYMTALDNRYYMVTVNAGSQETFTANKAAFEGILENLKLGSFNKEAAADYSNVDVQNFREYRNKANGLSMKVPADWKLESETDHSRVNFSWEKGDNRVSIYFSADKNTEKYSPATLQNSIKPSLVGMFNEKYVTVNDSGNFEQGDVKGAKLSFDAQARNIYFGTRAILAVSGDYFINMQMISSGTKKADFDDKQLTQIWNSVQLGAVDPNKLIIIDDGSDEEPTLGKMTLPKTKISLDLSSGWEQKELEKYTPGNGNTPGMYHSQFTFSNFALDVITYDIQLPASQAKSQVSAIQNSMKGRDGVKDFESLAEQKVGNNTYWISQYVAESDTYDFAVMDVMTYSDTGIHILEFSTLDLFCGDMFAYYSANLIANAVFE